MQNPIKLGHHEKKSINLSLKYAIKAMLQLPAEILYDKFYGCISLIFDDSNIYYSGSGTSSWNTYTSTAYRDTGCPIEREKAIEMFIRGGGITKFSEYCILLSSKNTADSDGAESPIWKDGNFYALNNILKGLCIIKDLYEEKEIFLQQIFIILSKINCKLK